MGLVMVMNKSDVTIRTEWFDPQRMNISLTEDLPLSKTGVSKKKAAVLTALFAAGAWFGLKAYIYQQNQQITQVNCHFGEVIDGVLRDKQYYEQAVNVAFPKAADQFCLAEIYKGSSLGEARKFYKLAAEQGLAIAQKALCVRSMFSEDNMNFEEFEPLCCPQTDYGFWKFFSIIKYMGMPVPKCIP